MKSRIAVCSIALTLGVGAGACGSQSRGDGTADPPSRVGSTAQDLIATTGNIMMWPAGPIAWDGLVGTWPMAVWSTGAIGGLAFDVTGVTGLGVTGIGLGGIGAVPITDPFLNAFNAGFGAPFAGVGMPAFGAAGLFAPAFGFGGAFAPFPVDSFGFGAFGAGGFLGATVAGGVASPWLTPFLAPTLTSSALMFNDLAMTSAMTPLMFNVTFTAAAAQTATAMNMGSLSIFATPIASTALTGAAIPFSSLAFPIGIPAAALAAPVGIAAPVLGGAVAAPFVGAAF